MVFILCSPYIELGVFLMAGSKSPRLDAALFVILVLIGTTRASGQVDVLSVYNLANVATNPPAVADMCAAIALAGSRAGGPGSRPIYAF